jgi:hypothetical protein
MVAKSTLTRWTNKALKGLKYDHITDYDYVLEDDLKVILRNKMLRYQTIKKPSGKRSDLRRKWLKMSPPDKAIETVQGILNYQPEPGALFESAAELIRNTAIYYISKENKNGKSSR